MSDTAVSLLTAPGSAAIAVVEVRGPRAYSLAKHLFTPAGKPLPDAPDVGRFWFGTLGSDEVVISVTEPNAVEVHCHGGPRVVRWVVEQFTASGAEERTPLSSPRVPRLTCSGSFGRTRGASEGFELLQRAPTLRTASILLDQMNGAFANEVRRILALLESDPASAASPLLHLARRGNAVGRHLVEPWKVVFAGAPNVGKSSLVNALAGYQRSVVSEVAGTTRDAVGVRVAFDGWPFELIDTAGIRAAEGLEAEGIERTERAVLDADLVVSVLDGTATEQVGLTSSLAESRRANKANQLQQSMRAVAHIRGGVWLVVNKADQPLADWARNETEAQLVSATTGEGLSELIRGISSCLTGAPLLLGDAVPFTPQLIQLINDSLDALIDGRPAEAARFLREALAE